MADHAHFVFKILAQFHVDFKNPPLTYYYAYYGTYSSHFNRVEYSQ